MPATRRRSVHLLLGLAVVMAAAAPATAEEPIPDWIRNGNKVEAIINGEIITSYQIYQRILPIIRQIDRREREGGVNAAGRQLAIESQYREARDQMFEEALLLQASKAANVSITDQYLEQRIVDQHGSAEAFKRSVEEQGLTYIEGRQRFRDSLAIAQYVYIKANHGDPAYEPMVGRVYDTYVSPASIREYYDTNRDTKFRKAPEVSFVLLKLLKESDFKPVRHVRDPRRPETAYTIADVKTWLVDNAYPLTEAPGRFGDCIVERLPLTSLDKLKDQLVGIDLDLFKTGASTQVLGPVPQAAKGSVYDVLIWIGERREGGVRSFDERTVREEIMETLQAELAVANRLRVLRELKTAAITDPIDLFRS
jgi:hypothetical protein